MTVSRCEDRAGGAWVGRASAVLVLADELGECSIVHTVGAYSSQSATVNEQRYGNGVRVRAWPSTVMTCGKAMVTKMLEAKFTSEPTESAMPRMRSGKISLSSSHEMGPNPTCHSGHNHRQ
jgi:hypothetical protein